MSKTHDRPSPPDKSSGEPTIRDVARLAGVSRATAARALGGYGYASAEVGQRVRAAADQVGYRRNSLARRMRTKQSHTLGVVVSDIGLPFFAQILHGISDVAQSSGYEVLLLNSDADLVKERAAVRVLSEDRVDGLIVSPASTMDGEHLAEIIDHGIAVVLIDRAVRGVRADAVVVDNFQAAHNAVTHLIRLGHRRIGVLAEASSPPLDSRDWASEPTASTDPILPSASRVAGCLMAMLDAGVALDEGMIRIFESDRAAARNETRALLALPEPATAIFATDAVMTLGVFEEARQLSRVVPDALSIVGFDDPEWATVVEPALTVVSQPMREIGASAARRVLARLGGDQRDPTRTVLQTSFLERASTGPCQAR